MLQDQLQNGRLIGRGRTSPSPLHVEAEIVVTAFEEKYPDLPLAPTLGVEMGWQVVSPGADRHSGWASSAGVSVQLEPTDSPPRQLCPTWSSDETEGTLGRRDESGRVPHFRPASAPLGEEPEASQGRTISSSTTRYRGPESQPEGEQPPGQGARRQLADLRDHIDPERHQAGLLIQLHGRAHGQAQRDWRDQRRCQPP